MKSTAAADLKDVVVYWAEGEISSFIKVWLSATVALIYCYFSGKMLAKGPPKLAAFLPVICLFIFLPLQLRSMHLCGLTAFFLTWLANFKLLMYAFHQGPLSNPSVSLLQFFVIACLPIKLESHGKPQNSSKSTLKTGNKPFLKYAIKGILLSLLIKSYGYEDYMSTYIHPRFILVLYSFHIYISLELILAAAAAAARVFLGVELEPQFNNPYLSSSLQDFWGRRWNLMVTRILHPSVYLPVLNLSTGIIGRNLATLPAVLSTFVVSGLMHELIFYYLSRAKPSWGTTGFFLLHGVSLAAEISVKKAVNGRWLPPRGVGTILTVCYVMTTGLWLFFPQLLRGGAEERALAEFAAVGAFFKDVGVALGLYVQRTG